ncbi:hypothetical protein CMV30_03535 [Nibricoccus aquaticus]|uniref:Nitrate reductase n=1 Tax=Nibricoccus aquaticus TaxID=2576891 RepID=A0A290QFF0_9BACT|nr:hypothetical protein CMV30_03535 [Nibricoccus aquaticus]
MAAVIDPSYAEAIKRWTREVLRLGEDDVVTVSEIACVDAGCPLVETVVAVFAAEGETRSWRFTRPRVAVTKMMVMQTLATPAKRS